MAPKKTDIQASEAALRSHALGYPESCEEFPWDEHRALKVKGKTFVFMSKDTEVLSLSVKLPRSHDIALMLPFAQPTGYGLGKSGWVSARFEPGTTPPLDMLQAWIDESYRAIAPKKLVAQLDGASPGPAREPAKAAKKAGTAKKAAKAVSRKG